MPRRTSQGGFVTIRSTSTDRRRVSPVDHRRCAQTGRVCAGGLDRGRGPVDPQIGCCRLDGVCLEEERSRTAEGIEHSMVRPDAGKPRHRGGDRWVETAGHRLPAPGERRWRGTSNGRRPTHIVLPSRTLASRPDQSAGRAVPAGVIAGAGEPLEGFTDEVFDVEPVVIAGSVERRADGEAPRRRPRSRLVIAAGESRFGAAWIGDGGLDDEKIVGQAGWIGDDRCGGGFDES